MKFRILSYLAAVTISLLMIGALAIAFTKMARVVRLASIHHPSEVFRDERIVTLVEAAERDDLEELDNLVKNGVAIDQPGLDGITPLLFLVYRVAAPDISSFDDQKVTESLPAGFAGIKYLLKHGANPNSVSREGWTPMHLSAVMLDSRWLKLLLDHGGDPNVVASYRGRKVPPIFYALGSHRDMNAKLMVEAGADCNFQDKYGRTPLHLCVQGDFSLAKLMIEHGARADVRSVSGESPAHIVFRKLQNFGGKEKIRFESEETRQAFLDLVQCLSDRGYEKQ